MGCDVHRGLEMQVRLRKVGDEKICFVCVEWGECGGGVGRDHVDC